MDHIIHLVSPALFGIITMNHHLSDSNYDEIMKAHHLICASPIYCAKLDCGNCGGSRIYFFADPHCDKFLTPQQNKLKRIAMFILLLPAVPKQSAISR